MATKKSERRKTAALPGPDAAPPLESALAALSRRHLRAVLALLARIAALGLLMALLSSQSPALAKARVLMDAVAGALALWPFFTALGRLYGWRIALGRSYVRESRFADADCALSPLVVGLRARLFDATGEGAYWLATARRGLGREAEARPLWETIAREHPVGEWGERARAALSEM